MHHLDRRGEDRDVDFAVDDRVDRRTQRTGIFRQRPLIHGNARDLRAAFGEAREKFGIRHAVFLHGDAAPASGSESRLSSSARRRSRQVFGSGTASVTGTPNSLSAATGLGPRATIGIRRSASTNCSIGYIVCTTRASARVPTPVRKITMSKPFAASVRAKASASVFDSRGTSRIDGATVPLPP